MSLLAKADALRQEADFILHTQGLWAMIEAVGPAQIVGSYAYQVMTRPDIDINLQIAHDQDVAAMMALGARVVTSLTVVRLVYVNVQINPATAFEFGLYLGIRLPCPGGLWQVDVWGFGPEQYARHNAQSDALWAGLRGIEREAVLALKDALMQRGDYRKTVSSLALYEALISGVRTPAEFDAWWAARE